MTNAATQKLINDLRVLVEDAEDLAKATAAKAGDKIDDQLNEVRSRLQQTAANIKPHLDRAEELLEEKASSAVVGMDHCVRSSPWTAVGTAACIGALIGILIGRR